MKKRFLLLTLVLLFAVFLVSCDGEEIPVDPTLPVEPTPTPTPALTAITISGFTTEVETIAYEAEFDVLEGVTAMGNDGVDYTSQITYTSTSTISDEDMLDTSVTGNHAIRYEVEVGAVKQQRWRYVEVETPTSDDGYILPGWRAFLNDWEGTTGNLSVVDDELVLNLTNINASQGWNIQVIQDATALYDAADNTGHMELEAGKTYKATFDAKASVAGTIKFAVGHSTSWVSYFESTLTPITTEMDTYSFEFTLEDSAKDYTVPAQFKIEMGTLFSGQTAPQSFTLDNVKMEVKEGDVFVATDLILNGTMDAEGGIIVEPTDPVWTGYGMTVVETETDVTITYADTPAEWWNNNAQLEIVDFDGTKDSVLFTFTGVASQEYAFKIEGGGVNNEVTVEADGTEQELVVPLDMMTKAQREGLNKIVVFSKTLDASGTLVLNTWEYGPLLTPVWIGYGLDVVETETDVTITYADTPTEWWNNNAQLAVVDFDGTKDSVLFTFTGVTSQEYVFKIEGGGVNREVTVEADGTEQELLIPLSTMTEAQRDALDLIVVFPKTAAASGTLVVKNWEYGPEVGPIDPEWVGYGMTVVETETDVTITYADTPAMWWNNNAQLEVVGFDGTKESVQFTFTGVNGHEYAFKIEGGGVNKEVKITADGTEQQVLLTLTEMTEAQRDGLNLIIIFTTTLDASGTLVVDTWEYGPTS